MPLKVEDATLADFGDAFENFKAVNSGNQMKFLLFLADKDPSTSLSWCPDCNVAEPVIYKMLGASEKDVLLLRAYVGDRPTWRNPSHPLRIDNLFKLKGVPTLIRWENEGVANRLEDHEAHIESKIEALMSI
ncbi:thioredoxin-like protein Clot [Dioscorea cayenensis subsp. rotundata]|uniref:Thioredoxin-like protein Clot n=1 Tax=Dioscorea cayennensis subsp. rotundata TaxID=55577 RepID=A0AB40D557_DIOCR|nr:thioredoxin-like protein Clot [Dioscorea cayenensis subsp. rotundata]